VFLLGRDGEGLKKTWMRRHDVKGCEGVTAFSALLNRHETLDLGILLTHLHSPGLVVDISQVLPMLTICAGFARGW